MSGDVETEHDPGDVSRERSQRAQFAAHLLTSQIFHALDGSERQARKVLVFGGLWMGAPSREGLALRSSRIPLKEASERRHIYMYAPASLLPLPPLGMVMVCPRPPCGPVVGVDRCECWLMES